MINRIYACFCNLTTWKKGLILFLLFFPFRLIFGIFSEFWFEDEMQIYLIGLKYYATAHWPFYGPDIVYTSSQIPGALQGLLVGLPFYLFQFPEAPYIILNSLTFLSLFLLGHYMHNYLTPKVPEWFLWTWLFTAPWVLNYSTHVLNPSYVLPGAILFFISFMEIIPVFRKGFMRTTTAFFLMGFSLLWIFQLHMSWILLMPFIAFACYKQLRISYQSCITNGAIFILGCLTSGSLVIPTFIQYGIISGSGDTAANVIFNISNVKEIITVLVRLLSFGTFELTRFMGANTHARLDYFTSYIWLSPFIIFAGLFGVAQLIWMLVAWFKKSEVAEWRALKSLVFAVFFITYISFFFSVKGPSSHTFYLMLPVVMIYSFYCWQPLFEKKWIRNITVIFLVSGLIFHLSLMHFNYHHKSMYKDREKPLKAIEQKDYHVLGERRSYDRN